MGSSLYSATKFGLRGFAAGLRQDVHGRGVEVTVVFPGFVSDAGMFADSGVALPRWVGTRTPDQVAAAVVKGIEEGRAEMDVAPLGLRAGALAELRGAGHGGAHPAPPWLDRHRPRRSAEGQRPKR